MVGVVGNGATVWWTQGINRVFLLPVEARTWMDRYDRGEPVEPMTFRLRDMTGLPIKRVPMER